jgi:hypothetical protein
MRVREVEKMIPEVHREIMKKFPGTNKYYAALLGAFNEAADHHRQAMSVIDDVGREGSPDLWWHAMGQLYAANWVIRRIAEQLGVPNEV